MAEERDDEVCECCGRPIPEAERALKETISNLESVVEYADSDPDAANGLSSNYQADG